MPTCTQIGLCILGPDNRPHSSPTSVTSFTDMSPERVFKGWISCGSNDTAFPPLPPLCLGCTFFLWSRAQNGWLAPALPWVCLQGSLHSCRPPTSGLESQNTAAGWAPEQVQPQGLGRGDGVRASQEAQREPTCYAGDAGDSGSVPGSGRSPGGGDGNPLQSSCLENLMGRGAWRAVNTVLGGHKVGQD